MTRESLIKLIEGDCLDVMRKMPDGSIPLIVTSPPYNLRTSTGNGLKGAGGNWPNAALRSGYAPDDGDNMPRGQYVSWLRQRLDEMFRLISDDGAIYLNMKDRVQGGLVESPDEIVAGYPVRQRVIWARVGGSNHGAGFFTPSHEFIYMLAKPKFKLKPGHGLTTVWNMAQQSTEHPAPFPVELPSRCIAASHAETILDPFAGSGTTGVAALLHCRDAILIERQPAFVEMAFRRVMGALGDSSLKLERKAA